MASAQQYFVITQHVEQIPRYEQSAIGPFYTRAAAEQVAVQQSTIQTIRNVRIVAEERA